MKGILLLNLGTPDSPSPKAVGKYLREFLMDKWVVDIPFLFRWILVHLLITPRRKFATSRAYHKIWNKRGSPLLIYLETLADKLRLFIKVSPNGSIESTTPVMIAMRYGNPSIQAALENLKELGVAELVVLALYPQYAESTVRSSQEEISRLCKKLGYKVKIKYVPPFYSDMGFIKSFATLIKPVLDDKKPDHLLLSFHGLPERHVKKTDPTGHHCLMQLNCCAQIGEGNTLCYRAQCFETARLMAKDLGVSANDYSVSFQSRLGRTPWIKPFTDEVYGELVAAGKKTIAVACPSFAADCLETLEEVALRGREDFIQRGGKELFAVGCLNAEPMWVEAAAKLIAEEFAGQ